EDVVELDGGVGPALLIEELLRLLELRGGRAGLHLGLFAAEIFDLLALAGLAGGALVALAFVALALVALGTLGVALRRGFRRGLVLRLCAFGLRERGGREQSESRGEQRETTPSRPHGEPLSVCRVRFD